MVLQLFRINEKFPTYEQMKMQAYKAIINGAVGILWWGFVSEKGIEAEWYRLNNHQAYLNFQRISREVMALEPVLISPARPELLASVSDSNIEWLAKSDAEESVIFASNFSEVPADKVTITLSPSAPRFSGPVEVYGEGRTLTIDSGRNNLGVNFSDAFGPYEVHVYKLKLK